VTRSMPAVESPAPGRPDPTDADLRVLDAVLAMLLAGTDRVEARDLPAALDYVGWARDLLTQLLAEPVAGPADRHHERLSVAHRDLSRAACDGDTEAVAEVAEFLGAVREACTRGSELRARGSAA
jgi:hypothetical protein